MTCRAQCEGRIIRVGLALADGSHFALCWAKSFGDAEECWTVAAAMMKAAADRVALSNEVISALCGGARGAELASGASIRITHFEPATFNHRLFLYQLGL